MCWECLGDVWEVFGGCVGCVWGSVWVMCWQCLGDVLGVFGRFVGDV